MKTPKRRWMGTAFLAVAVLMTGVTTSWGFSLSVNQNLTGNPSSLVGDGAGNTIANRPITGGNLYDWGDVNGDGVRDDPVASPGLDMGSYQITNGTGSHIVLDLNGGALSGTASSINFVTRATVNASGRIEILTTNSIDCGGLNTSTSPTTTSSPPSGEIRIGASGSRAGNVRVASLITRAGADRATPGNITIHGDGFVRVMNASNVPGNILTYSARNRDGAGDQGLVTVTHDGEFLARHIYTYHTTDNRSLGGHVFLNGDILQDGASGACAVSNIWTYSIFVGANGGRGGNVTITGYTDVHVHDIDTRSGKSDATAGSVAITALPMNIQITGAINLRNTSNPANSGNLTVNAGGRVTLASLNLGNVKSALLSAGERVEIVGALLGFPTETPANGLLDAPSGTTIFYDDKLPANSYLGGASYVLKSGGRLSSGTQKGTVMLLK